MEIDQVLVGAGPFGLTVARRLAEAGQRVVVIDKRDHIGGNAHSAIDPTTGIEVHTYGAHIFHTANQRVWDWVGRFSAFTDYQHRVWTTHQGQVYPMPINLATINQFYQAAYSPDQARNLIASLTAQSDQAAYSDQVSPGEQAGALDRKCVAMVGPDLYRALIRGYTAKQWGTDPALLPAETINRLPVRYDYDTRYFSDPHQGLPKDGYHRLWHRLADHDRIEVHLKTDFFDQTQPWSKAQLVDQVPVVYTGPIDRFFDYNQGELSWRTVDFTWEHPATGDYQGCAVMNYADQAVPHTRTIEFRHFHPERTYPAEATVIATEFPRQASREDQPYYPVGSRSDMTRLARYLTATKQHPKVHFGGRLGRYQYLDMDKAMAAALGLADQLLNGKAP